ncbi:hypothetical protein [Streptomyces sp. CA-253872]|uniref:hypothetical protein n=1 Tax=Streptomyces sp. CA-253872 TaxID=3240067 RepID=UPI003D946E12
MPGAWAKRGRRRTVWLYGGLALFAAGLVVVALAVNALRSGPGCHGGCVGAPRGEATSVGRAEDRQPLLVVVVPSEDDGPDTAAVVSAAGGALGAVLGGTAMLLSVLRRRNPPPEAAPQAPGPTDEQPRENP